MFMLLARNPFKVTPLQRAYDRVFQQKYGQAEEADDKIVTGPMR